MRTYLAGLGAAWLATTALHAQTTADPWARALALPTACYQSQDQFAEKSETVIDALSTEISNQKGTNARTNPSPANADPFEMARRMQETLAKDPQAAMKMMQTMGVTDPAALQAEQMQANQRATEMEQAEKAAHERYKAALKKAYVPTDEQMKALDKKFSNLPVESDPKVWALYKAEYDKVRRAEDKAYVATCAQWFGPNGEIRTFLKQYKDYLVQERIPQGEKHDTRATLSQAMLNGSSAYTSTTKLEAVHDYMKVAVSLFRERDDQPRCTATQCN